MDPVRGKRVAVLVEKFYEDLELWYPVLRLREAGCAVTIVGRWTWAMLVNRTALSAFNAVYRYIRVADECLFDIWPNVRTELHRVSRRGREMLQAQYADEIGAALHIGDRFDLCPRPARSHKNPSCPSHGLEHHGQRFGDQYRDLLGHIPAPSVLLELMQERRDRQIHQFDLFGSWVRWI